MAVTLQTFRPRCIGVHRDEYGGISLKVSSLYGLKDGDIEVAPTRRGIPRTEVDDVIHRDFLHIGTREWALGNSDVGDEASKYLFGLVENMSGYTWLELAMMCIAVVAAEALLLWYVTIGSPEVWVSNNARHFKKKNTAAGGEDPGDDASLGGRKTHHGLMERVIA